MNKIETIGEDVLHGVEKVFSVVDKTGKVVESLIHNESTLKPVLVRSIQDAVALAGEVDTCITEKGLNLADDQKLLTAIKAYFDEIKATLIPEVEKVYGEIEADVTAAPATPVAAPPVPQPE